MVKAPQKKSLRQMADEVVAAARRDPANARTILGAAAQRFATMGLDRRNARHARDLEALAQWFASAALGSKSDFDERLYNSIEAYRMGADSDMELVAIEQQIRQEEGPPHSSVTPASFTKDTALGRYADFKYAPTEQEYSLGVRQEDTLAVWPGRKEEAQAFTLDFTLTNPAQYPPVPDDPDVEPQFLGRPYGFVEYGSDGVKTRVLFDIGFGTRFTVVGNYIAAGAGMGPIPGLDADPPTISQMLRIGCSLGAFAAPSTAPVTYTAFVDDLGIGLLSDPIQRPVKAVALLPLLCDINAGSTNINFLDYNAKIIYVTSWPANTISASPIPLSPDVAYVRLTNNTGDTASYRVVFQLAL